MSLTGNFMGAEEALAFGLVNHVVPHADLMPFTRRIAKDIAGNEADGVRRMLQTYKEYAAETDAWENEATVGAQWRRQNFATEKVAERRAKIMERGRTQ